MSKGLTIRDLVNELNISKSLIYRKIRELEDSDYYIEYKAKNPKEVTVYKEEILGLLRLSKAERAKYNKERIAYFQGTMNMGSVVVPTEFVHMRPEDVYTRVQIDPAEANVRVIKANNELMSQFIGMMNGFDTKLMELNQYYNGGKEETIGLLREIMADQKALYHNYSKMSSNLDGISSHVRHLVEEVQDATNELEVLTQKIEILTKENKKLRKAIK